MPLRFVLADLAVAGIAQAAPTTMAQLNAVRGLSGRGLRGDVAKEILEAVQRGKEFPPEQLSNVALADLNYYFEPVHEPRKRYRFKSQWRQYVKFEQRDLLNSDYGQGFDLIVCRNVMIYFNRDSKYQVYRKFNQALKENGVLFVGGAEQLLDIQLLGYRPLSPYFLQKQSC